MLAEFKLDYNQRHFVRNETFAKAADSIQGPARKVCWLQPKIIGRPFCMYARKVYLVVRPCSLQ